MKHAIGLILSLVVLTSAHAQEVKRDIPYTKNADKSLNHIMKADSKTRSRA